MSEALAMTFISYFIIFSVLWLWQGRFILASWLLHDFYTWLQYRLYISTCWLSLLSPGDDCFEPQQVHSNSLLKGRVGVPPYCPPGTVLMGKTLYIAGWEQDPGFSLVTTGISVMLDRSHLFLHPGGAAENIPRRHWVGTGTLLNVSNTIVGISVWGTPIFICLLVWLVGFCSNVTCPFGK